MGAKAYREARNVAQWVSQTFPHANILLKIPTKDHLHPFWKKWTVKPVLIDTVHPK